MEAQKVLSPSIEWMFVYVEMTLSEMLEVLEASAGSVISLQTT